MKHGETFRNKFKVQILAGCWIKKECLKNLFLKRDQRNWGSKRCFNIPKYTIKFNCDAAAIKTNLTEIRRTRDQGTSSGKRRIGGRGLARMRGLRGHPEKVFSVLERFVLIRTKDPAKVFLNPFIDPMKVLLLIPREP